MSNLESYKEELTGVFADQLKGLWNGGEDRQFLQDLAADLAAQQWAIKTATSDDKRQEYKENLQHLETQLQGRIQARKSRLTDAGIKILQTTMTVALRIALTSLLG